MLATPKIHLQLQECQARLAKRLTERGLNARKSMLLHTQWSLEGKDDLVFNQL